MEDWTSIICSEKSIISSGMGGLAYEAWQQFLYANKCEVLLLLLGIHECE